MNELDRLFSAWLSGPLSPTDAQALCALLEDPGHRRRWRALADLEGTLAERGAAIGAEPAHASPISTRRLRIKPKPPARRQRRWWVMLIAASLLFAVGGTWWQQQQREDDRPRLAGRVLEHGETINGPASLQWAAGIAVEVAAQASGRVAPVGRGLELDAGDLAVRVVAQAPGRAFTVRSAEVTIRALDARFTVHRAAEATSVVVEEGAVSFTPVDGVERTVTDRALAGPPPSPASSSSPPAAGLVGWWPLDEGSGMIAHDRSGQGHDGRLVGPRWTADGLNFAGGDDRVDILPQGVLATLQDGDYTVSAWYRPAALPPDYSIEDPAHSQDALGVIVGRTGYTLGIHVDPKGRFFMEHFLADHSAQIAWTPPVATVGNWLHLAGIVDRTHGETRIAVDGVIRGRMTWTAGLPTCRYVPSHLWRIGIGEPGNLRYRWPATGLIREVRMYDRALDGHDLQGLAGSR